MPHLPRSYARHDFETAARDWGFRELIPHHKLQEAADRYGNKTSAGFLGANGSLTIQCKVWGVTDAMRVAERAQTHHRGHARSAHGGGPSHVGASSASSTSLGSVRACPI